MPQLRLSCNSSRAWPTLATTHTWAFSWATCKSVSVIWAGLEAQYGLSDGPQVNRLGRMDVIAPNTRPFQQEFLGPSDHSFVIWATKNKPLNSEILLQKAERLAPTPSQRPQMQPTKTIYKKKTHQNHTQLLKKNTNDSSFFNPNNRTFYSWKLKTMSSQEMPKPEESHSLVQVDI